MVRLPLVRARGSRERIGVSDMSSQLGFFGAPEKPVGDTTVRDAALSPCGTWRWWLSRIWNSEKPIGLVVMLNPSTADHTRDDPTVQSLMRRGRFWGWGGYYIVNLCAFRSSDPSDLAKAEDPIGPENDAHIDRLAEQATSRRGRIVVAWGAYFGDVDKVPAKLRGRDVAVLKRLCGLAEVLCIGRNNDRSPTHPQARGKFRVADESPLEVFAAKIGGDAAEEQRKKPKREVVPFSARPPSPGDMPRVGSAPTGDCSYCGTHAEGRYGVLAQDKSRTLPLCNGCGPSHHPTIREVWAKDAEGKGS
jgi:hypothetical protein